MKKILFFMCIISLFWSCEPDYEIEYINPEVQQGDDSFPDDTGNNNQYPHGENNLLQIYGGWSHDINSGVLILPIKAELATGFLPDHVAIKLYSNGTELTPQGYWDFKKDPQNSQVWRRINQIDLNPGQLQSRSLEIKLYTLIEDGSGYKEKDRLLLAF